MVRGFLYVVILILCKLCFPIIKLIFAFFKDIIQDHDLHLHGLCKYLLCAAIELLAMAVTTTLSYLLICNILYSTGFITKISL